MTGFRTKYLLGIIVFFAFQTTAQQVEKLDRGLVAIRKSADSIYIGWRLFANDPKNIGFNVYRSEGDSKPVKISKSTVTSSTNFYDVSAPALKNYTYSIRPVTQGKEAAADRPFTVSSNTITGNYLDIPLETPAGYTPNDASVGDLDGDGRYEIIIHQTGRSRDNSSDGVTDPPVFQAYTLEGKLLWSINLGKNIREGAHYTQFMVYDLDGDGSAEFACKTADGTIDGKGKVIGDSSKDYRNAKGKILEGPEFFTIFSGRTGEALATADYLPARGNLGGWGGIGGNGGNDNTGNRVDRFLACVAYLDGKRPSVIMCRGYYGRTVLAAWDWREGKLTSRWVFDSQDGKNPFSGMGYHNLSVADVDQDGKDEIVYGSMVVDDNGKGLFTTGLRHGDALHVSDLDPSKPGLEVFGVHEIEEKTTGPGAAVYSAKTGEIYFRGNMDEDAGRGVAEDIDPSNPGAEMWWSGSKGLFSMKGEKIGESPSSTNFLIWWTDDLHRQLLDGNHIDDYKKGRLFTAEGCSSNNGTKATPALSADIFGDWREELILRTNDNKHLKIFTSDILSTHRIPTLMQDHQYRMSIVWQNVGYNQPPHLRMPIQSYLKD